MTRMTDRWPIGETDRHTNGRTIRQADGLWTDKCTVQVICFCFFKPPAVSGRGGGGPPVMQRSPKQNSSNSIRRKQQVPQGGWGGSPRPRYESFFHISQFSDLTFLLENQQSTLLSNTQFLLWFYGKPAGAKCP